MRAADAAGLPVLTARVRESVGTLASVRLRKQGLTPGQLFSLPGNRTLALSFDSKDAAAHVSCPPGARAPTARQAACPLAPATTQLQQPCAAGRMQGEGVGSRRPGRL
jgi:hypothetical protein